MDKQSIELELESILAAGHEFGTHTLALFLQKMFAYFHDPKAAGEAHPTQLSVPLTPPEDSPAAIA